MQLLGSFLTDIGLLVNEALQRRAFLAKNITRLGPGGAVRAKLWPLGDVRGAQRVIGLAIAHLAGLCFLWQAILLFPA
jgi:hypothetical protein